LASRWLSWFDALTVESGDFLNAEGVKVSQRAQKEYQKGMGGANGSFGRLVGLLALRSRVLDVLRRYFYELIYITISYGRAFA
jgi:hypothetical protein